MQLIDEHLAVWDRALPQIGLRVDRLTLAKRRWRGVADDGCEFGFDLDRPLVDGEAFFSRGSGRLRHRAKQRTGPRNPSAEFGVHAADAARLGWMIGNLHFPLAIEGEMLRVADDPALRQLFERERISFTARDAIFQPLAGGHRH